VKHLLLSITSVSDSVMTHLPWCQLLINVFITENIKDNTLFPVSKGLIKL